MVLQMLDIEKFINYVLQQGMMTAMPLIGYRELPG